MSGERLTPHFRNDFSRLIITQATIEFISCSVCTTSVRHIGSGSPSLLFVGLIKPVFQTIQSFQKLMLKIGLENIVGKGENARQLFARHQSVVFLLAVRACFLLV